MAINIEIKATVRDVGRVASIAQGLSGGPGTRLVQHDVFFNCARGKLKLRRINGAEAELIAYERAAGEQPRPSDYSIAKVDDFEQIRGVLARSLGELAEVRKVRILHLVGRTRIHLDAVEGLGDFLELEVVLGDGDDEAAAMAEAESLMAALGVEAGDLLDRTYAEMLAGAEELG